MNRQITISYWWKCDSGIEIPEEHMEALEEDAYDRIFKMIKEGYVEGILSTSIRFGKEEVPEEDEDDGIEYSGGWSIEKKDEE